MRFFGPLAPLAAIAALALGGSALGAAGTITSVAGDGSAAFGGDDGAATQASLHDPESVAALPDGGYLIADSSNNRIRRVGPGGTITTVAGTGTAGYNGDSIAATGAELNHPEGVAALPDGGFLVADSGNSRIRRVAPGGTIFTVAGTGTADYDGNGAAATEADLSAPRAAVPTSDGGFLIADTGNHVVRRVTPGGTISTVAGTGTDGYDGDGGPATEALLDAPDDVAPTNDGGLLIADYDRDVIRRVSPAGTISTVAGDSSGGSDSDDDDEEDSSSPSELEEPADVELLPDGGFLIADHGNGRVLHVLADGSIQRFAGSPSGAGFAGDGGPATAAKLAGPHGLAITSAGDVLIADGHNHRVRLVDADFVAPEPETAPGGGQTQTPGEAAPVPEPVLGRSVVVTPGFGIVKVKRPGKGNWTRLDGDSRLPVGGFVNVRRGSVALTSALAGENRSQTATFWDGVFQIRQARGGTGMTGIVLRGGGFARCRRARASSRPQALTSRRRRAVRRLWAKDDNGRFRTHGRDSVATTRGTVWSTEDRCTGTLTRVREGQVRVRHRHSRRSVLVRAGQKYLARRSHPGR